jgi:hypothetical protein
MTEKTAEIFDLHGKATGKLVLPQVFSTPIRPDVIKRAVLAIQSNRLHLSCLRRSFSLNFLFYKFFLFPVLLLLQDPTDSSEWVVYYLSDNISMVCATLQRICLL